MSNTAITDQEVRSRLEGIQRYNDYFAVEADEKGQPLRHHIVGPRQLWNIMTREWRVDPTKFGIKEPPPLPKFGPQPAVQKPKEDLTDGL